MKKKIEKMKSRGEKRRQELKPAIKEKFVTCALQNIDYNFCYFAEVHGGPLL